MGRTSRKRFRKKKLKLTEISKNEEDELIHFKAWMLSNNCLSVCNLLPYNFPDTGRGLKTLKDIKAGDTIIKIPYQMLITTSTLSESYINILFLRNECYSAQCVLSVFILYEAHLGKQSNWYHYINSLPQTFTTPDFCYRKEKSLLPAFILDSMYHSNKMQSDFKLLTRSMNCLISDGKGNCPHCKVIFKKIITFDKYKWAYYIVNSRAIYNDAELYQDVTINVMQPNNIALAPYLDLFNHDVHTAVHVSVVTDEDMNKFYQINTLKSFNEGSQVFINYGSHNNVKLYIDYGFFIPNNPLDEVCFDISDVQAHCAIARFKLNFIISNNLQKNMTFLRQGLNYNAMSTLFVVTTKLQREIWSMKIYNNSFTKLDLIDIYNIAKQILNLKKREFTNYLHNMRRIEQCSPSLSIAVNLLQEYLAILNESYNNMNVLCN